MKLIKKLKEMLLPFSEQDIVEAFQDRLEKSNFEGVSVNEAFIGDEGIYVDFADMEGDVLSAFFTYDDEEGAHVIVDDSDDESDFNENVKEFFNMDMVQPQMIPYDQEDIDKEFEPEDDNVSLDTKEVELLVVDLSSIEPPLIEAMGETYINLTELSWMTDSVLLAILNADEIEDMEEEPEFDFGEAQTTVVRGGKKVRVVLVRRKRRKRLSPKQKAGIRKGVLKRRSQKGAIQRKRKKSLKLRKRLNIRKRTNKRFKVQGTSS